jgi:hypothetical protein
MKLHIECCGLCSRAALIVSMLFAVWMLLSFPGGFLFRAEPVYLKFLIHVLMA